MPANLPPRYFDAERLYKQAKTPGEKISALEEMLAVMPKHKGTDHMRAEIRGRIARLHEAEGKKARAQRASFDIEREGAGQVSVIGLANSGKSSLIDSLTNASPAVADYPFSTQNALPGMMDFENIKIQLVDTPALNLMKDYWWLPQILRKSDALLVSVDLGFDPLGQIYEIIDRLGEARIYIDSPPDDEDIVTWPKKSLLVGCKIDMDRGGSNYSLMKSELGERFPLLGVSVLLGSGLTEIKHRIFQLLQVIRIYTKVPGQHADMDDPIILPSGSTLMDAAMHLHKDFVNKLKFARLWGSGKFDGINIKKEHVLSDGDVVEFHL